MNFDMFIEGANHIRAVPRRFFRGALAQSTPEINMEKFSERQVYEKET